MISSCILLLANAALPHPNSFSSSSVLIQLQAVRVAIRREGNFERACGRQLGSPHTQINHIPKCRICTYSPFWGRPAPEAWGHPVQATQRLKATQNPDQCPEAVVLWQGDAWFGISGSQEGAGRIPGAAASPCAHKGSNSLECLNPRMRGLCQQEWDLTI